MTMATEDKEPVKGFTPVELAFIKAVFRHSKARLNADWDKVAEEVSVKDAKCARERFRQISVKHSFDGQDGSPTKGGGESPGKVMKKRAARGKKSKKDEKAEEENGGNGGADGGDAFAV